MKINYSLYSYLLFLAIGLFTACSPKQKDITASTPELAHSLLWEISHSELSTPSYLFGTVHYIPNEYYFWPDTFDILIKQSEQLILEMNMQDMNPNTLMGIMGQAIMKDNQTIGDFLSPEEYQNLQAYFNEMGIPLMMMERLKPFFIYTIISMDFNQLGDMKSYEMELMKKAHQSNLDLLGLETVEYQLSIFDSIPYQLQANMVMDAIEKKQKDDMGSDDSINQLYEKYSAQDLNALYQMVSTADTTLMAYNDLLITQRNRDWIPVIKQQIHQKSSFIAVGAGHLGGKEGVINLLKKEGYQLKPVHINTNYGTD